MSEFLCCCNFILFGCNHKIGRIEKPHDKPPEQEKFSCPNCLKITKAVYFAKYPLFECCFIPLCYTCGIPSYYMGCENCQFEIDINKFIKCSICSCLIINNSKFCNECGSRIIEKRPITTQTSNFNKDHNKQEVNKSTEKQFKTPQGI
ncbi:hypothetical protein A0H76_2429 [Hepatospora eriocheir]|uniref:Zinc-ribbon 15 domain-containing protein n=1 Tax=Hepatospora eriocheir TaxID=1081669 RepID=A0A1X0QJX7_9MICR|nr:hypothetical protein A0H76_2429 [Hepatospora eriocheir]